MADDWRSSIQTLLASSRVAFLSTLGEHAPETSMAPYAMQCGDVLLHLSGLARHAANIVRDRRIGLMICTPEAATDSPLALPRLSLSGLVTAIPESGLQRARHTYLQRIPEAEPLFSFPDFRLYYLGVEKIHWVGGFGNARSIPRQAWYEMFDGEPVSGGGEA